MKYIIKMMIKIFAVNFRFLIFLLGYSYSKI